MLCIGLAIGADPDTITLCAFLAAATINRYALLLVLIHLFNEAAFILVDGGIYYNLLSGVACALLGYTFINVSYKLRQVLVLTGALFWLSAVDFYLFPTTETMLYNSFAYIVGAVDLYALFLLLSGGGNSGGIYSLLEHWFFILRYRILWVSNLRY